MNVAGGSITTHQAVTGLSAAEIKQLFEGLYSQIDVRANTSASDKEDIKAEVKEMQSTVTGAAEKNERWMKVSSHVASYILRRECFAKMTVTFGMRKVSALQMIFVRKIQDNCQYKNP